MDRLRSALKQVFHVTAGPLLVVLLVVGAAILAALGMKNVQVGGLIGLLLGKKKLSDQAIDVANSVASDRVGPDGKLIPQGVADEHGMTQAVVVPIKNPGLFSDPNSVKYVPPGEQKPVEVVLPTGVKSSQVESVVVVDPGKIVVTVKDTSGVTAEHVDDLLKKYKT